MTTNQLFRMISYLLMILAFTTNAHAAVTDISTAPLNTLSVPSSTDVKPNVFFVLDDSGSMDWDFMPDWACASYSTRNSSCNSIGQSSSFGGSGPEFLFKNAAYNGIYYNPAVTYTPPVAVGSTGATNTTTFPSMTGTSAATGANTSSAMPNWQAVKDDAYGVQSTSSTISNLQNGAGAAPAPYFFTVVPGEYCTSASLRTCVTANAPSTSYPFPANVRWCNSSALSTCRATFSQGTGGYSYARAPSPRTATITITGSSSSVTVNGIVIGAGGPQIMNASFTATGTPSTNTVALGIFNAINNCTVNISGNCTVVGYSASVSGSVVTITAPGAITSTPVVTITGMTISSPTAFAMGVVPGDNLRTTITPTVSSYPYPGTNIKAVTRTDCAGTTCTYAEEMTNYANWWTYYRTRMQMMKTAASNAFSKIDVAADIANNVSRFRLGYMSINDNTNNDFLNLAEFTGTQKYNWYTKLIRANPGNSTPLRAALSMAGRYYAGKLDGTTLNGSTVSDPLQYSCQQNYTILSTDGFWNEGSGFNKMDGSTNVGNQDAGLSRPYTDGATAQLQTETSTLQQSTGILQLSSKNSKGKWGSWTTVSTCQPNSTTQCQYSWGSWVNAASCTVSFSSGTGSWGISSGTQCQYTGWSTWANASACTAVAQSTSPNYTVGTARACQTVSSSGGTSNTLADVAAYYYNTDLRNATATGADATGTCTGPTISPSTIANDLCADNVPSNGRDTATTQHMTTFTLGLGSQGQMVYAPTDGKDYWNDTSGDFYDVEKGTTANPSSGICSWQASGSGSCNWPIPVSNSNTNIDDLWHAAINGHGTYFSATNPASLSSSLTSALTTISNTPRPGTAAAAASSNPNVSASDNFVFSSSYKSVQWYGELIRQQITASGTLTGQNWSAMKLLDCATTVWAPNTNYIVGNGYRQGSQCYTVNTAYLSGAAFNDSTGNDSSNTTVANVDETATTLVPATPLTARTIYTKGTSGLIPFTWSSLSTTQQAYFTEPAITYASPTSGLSQFCSTGGTCLSNTLQTNNTIATGGAAGEALVNFLRGDRSNEGSYFLKRTHILGDIVSSQATYVQTPLFTYTDTNYSAFKSLMTTRNGMVYVGANDGMLHAFDATTGQESWAYIPSFVLPNIYKLADSSYSTQHQYFVDGSPQSGDICPNAPNAACTAAQWKTILVGGLNDGGKGYYALDITNPAAPVLLWEFTDANMGYTYGNPTITKLADGTWVVLVSSGYNNADGLGHLYVLNANTGALIRNISTGVGSAGSPSGLSRISGHVLNSATDNTSTAAYGGDILGNLWRFDINNSFGAAGYDAQLLVSLKDASGIAQPITVKPVLATINGNLVVFVGTGRYLGTTDVSGTYSATQTESFYAIKDPLALGTTPSVAIYANPRITTTSNNFVQQTWSSGTCPVGAPTSACIPNQEVRTSSSNAVDWTAQNGWYVDFLTGGERSTTNPQLVLGTLLFTTITPQASTVSACGPASGTAASFLYALDYTTGGAVIGANGVSGGSLGSGLVAQPVVIELADGTVKVLVRTSGTNSSSSNSSGSTGGDSSSVGSGEGGGSSDLADTIVTTTTINNTSSAPRRVTWRVLSTQ